ncbi:MAG: hypothetical protein ACLFUE_01510 [Desulfobacteraceae bacterium]
MKGLSFEDVVECRKETAGLVIGPCLSLIELFAGAFRLRRFHVCAHSAAVVHVPGADVHGDTNRPPGS